MSKVMKEMGRKGGLRQKETTTPEQRAEWGRKGGKMAGRGRPKKAEAAPAAASAKMRTAKAKAKRGKAKRDK